MGGGLRPAFFLPGDEALTLTDSYLIRDLVRDRVDSYDESSKVESST